MDAVEERKKRRKRQNRLAAQTSREKKKKYISGLEERLELLEKRNQELHECFARLSSENKRLNEAIAVGSKPVSKSWCSPPCSPCSPARSSPCFPSTPSPSCASSPPSSPGHSVSSLPPLIPCSPSRSRQLVPAPALTHCTPSPHSTPPHSTPPHSTPSPIAPPALESVIPHAALLTTPIMSSVDESKAQPDIYVESAEFVSSQQSEMSAVSLFQSSKGQEPSEELVLQVILSICLFLLSSAAVTMKSALVSALLTPANFNRYRTMMTENTISDNLVETPSSNLVSKPWTYPLSSNRTSGTSMSNSKQVENFSIFACQAPCRLNADVD